MEKLSLDKFKDLEIKNNQKSHFVGGGGSSMSETCHTNPHWHQGDTQTDYYSDGCGSDGNGDNNWVQDGSSMVSYSYVSETIWDESW